MIPSVVRTWAPRGQTPNCRRRYKREKVSVISGVSVSLQRQRLGLYYRLHLENIGQIEVCYFLRLVLRHRRGAVVVLLDNSNTHRGKAVRELLSQHPRLRVEYFASYAPELNPDECVWSLAKRELVNGRPDAVDELLAEVSAALKGIATSRKKLRSCIEQSELPPFYADRCILHAAVCNARACTTIDKPTSVPASARHSTVSSDVSRPRWCWN